MSFLHRKKVDYVECFNAFLNPELIRLDSELRIRAADIDADYNTRNVFQSTARVTERASMAESIITDTFIKTIHEYFEFMESQYMLPRPKDVNSIKGIIDNKSMQLAKAQYQGIECSYDALSSALTQSRLHILCRDASLLDRHLEKENYKAQFLKKSNQIKQTQIALWAAIAASILSIIALFE